MVESSVENSLRLSREGRTEFRFASFLRGSPLSFLMTAAGVPMFTEFF